jgi:hypothetical protein
MTRKTESGLIQEAQDIRDEVVSGANTKLRVYNMLLNTFNSYLHKDQSGELSALSTTAKNTLVASINEIVANKGVADGYAPLDSASKVPALYLPSYVDDIIEAATSADFPTTGEASKVYIALDTNKTYRWSGSTYVEVSPSDVNSVAGHTGIISIEQILAKLLTVDGAGSKLTSDMVSSGVITDLNAAWQTDINNALKIFNYAGSALNKPATADNANWLINVYGHVTNYGHQISAVNTENIYFRRVLGGVFGAWMKLWHSGNDGNLAKLDATNVFTSNQIIDPGGDINKFYSVNRVRIDGLHQIQMGVSTVPYLIGTVDGVIKSRLNFKLDGTFTDVNGNTLITTADYTASDVLAKLLTVDGAGSGLDADKLDGLDPTSFLRSDEDDSMGGKLTLTATTKPMRLNNVTTANRDAYATPAYGDFLFNSTTNKLNYHNGTAWKAVLDEDDPLDGGDANTLDGYDSTEFARLAFSNTFIGDIIIKRTAASPVTTPSLSFYDDATIKANLSYTFGSTTPALNISNKISGDFISLKEAGGIRLVGNTDVLGNFEASGTIISNGNKVLTASYSLLTDGATVYWNWEFDGLMAEVYCGGNRVLDISGDVEGNFAFIMINNTATVDITIDLPVRTARAVRSITIPVGYYAYVDWRSNGTDLYYREKLY